VGTPEAARSGQVSSASGSGAATRVLRPAMKLWKRVVGQRMDHVPKPADAPQVHVSGADPVRILIFGGGPAVGWGVRSHSLALPGALARTVAAQTGRGAHVDAVGDSQIMISTACERLKSLDISRYDAVLMTLGVNDALSLTDLDDWEHELGEVLDMLAARLPEHARVTVAGIQPIRSVPVFDSWIGGIADQHAQRLNLRSRRVIASAHGAQYAPLTVITQRRRDRYRSPDDYAHWGSEVASVLVPSIADSDASDATTGVKDAERAEQKRQAAVDRLGLMDHEADERITALVALAQNTMHTDIALFSILDHGTEKFKVNLGTSTTELPRFLSLCDETIRRKDGVMVLDATTDDRYVDHPLVTGDTSLRFYAGYPIEAPSGERIGALCVIDRRPRQDNEVDRGRLRDIALLIQRELWRYDQEPQ